MKLGGLNLVKEVAFYFYRLGACFPAETCKWKNKNCGKDEKILKGK